MPGTERAEIHLSHRPPHSGAGARIRRRSRTLDGGKPIKESRDIDIPMAAAHFFYHAGWADKLEYAVPGRQLVQLGVAGQVIPWNFPLLMLAWKIAPALACGNTVVLKPAETTPLTALLFAEICQQADLPPGVVNIVTGAGETGAALVDHPTSTRSRSPAPPRSASASSARSPAPAKLTLELGGKAANIVFDDAPLDQAVEGIVNGIFFNQGHVCCAGSRLLVQESIADDVWTKLKARIATLRLGDPLDKNTDVGAINSRRAAGAASGTVDTGDAEGAERGRSPCALPDRGFWFPPTVFTGVSQSHRIAREEIFGPVLSVLTFRTPEEAVDKANNTPYGLSAGVWTEKGSRILWMAEPAARGRRVGEHVQPLRSDVAVRRLQGIRVRARRRPARPGGLPRDDRGVERRASGVRQDLQAVHRRQVPALRIGTHLRGARARRAVPRARGARRRARTPRRGGGRAQGVRRLVGARRTTAGRCCIGSRR